MNRAATWKSLTVGAVLAGIGLFGAATAQAEGSYPPAPPAGITGSIEDCTGGGAHVSSCQTNGSTALRTAPRPMEQHGIYGPYISPNIVRHVAD